MEWSPQQEEALRRVDRWFQSGEKQVFRLFGYAGTGKTTLARHLAEGISGVKFAAYTGKAAQVLRESGCPDASTIHSLIYRPREKSRSRLQQLEARLLELIERRAPESVLDPVREQIREERKSLARPAFDLNVDRDLVETTSLIVIDECSMVDEYMGRDLCSLGLPILVLGDPAQLPPVGSGGYFTEHEPDVLLTEIHRQAKDNPIIALATRIRSGERLEPGQYGSSLVVPRSQLDPSLVYEADQLLVGRNVTRRLSNNRYRDHLGHGDKLYPEKGERLICLRNNHQLGVLNGAMFVAAERAVANTADTVLLSLENGAEPLETVAHTYPFLGVGKDDMPWYERLQADEFDYGYAITVHKAQGSQWGRVILFDEWFMRDSRQRWLYTAVTRAQEQITVVQW